MTGVIGERREGWRHPEGSQPRDQGREAGGTVCEPRSPRSAGQHRDAWERQEDPPSESPEGARPATSGLGTFGLQSKNKRVVLSHSLYSVLWQPQEAKTEEWSPWVSKQGQQGTHTQIWQNRAPPPPLSLQLPLQPPAPPSGSHSSQPPAPPSLQLLLEVEQSLCLTQQVSPCGGGKSPRGAGFLGRLLCGGKQVG